MEECIEEFMVYLKEVKNASVNTIQSYKRDLMKMCAFMERQGIREVDMITVTNINTYMLQLEKQGLSTATISRNIASMKAFFHFLMKEKKIDYEPIEYLKSPVIEKKKPSVLSVSDVDRLLSQPSGSSPKEVRDKAMIELLYATGIRVSELVNLQLEDVNLKMDYIVCHNGNKKDRIIPFGREAKKSIQTYLEKYRNELSKGHDEQWMFLNCQGHQMSRQGFWKIIKGYGEQAGIKGEITPHTIRHSFAAHLVSNGADLRSVQEMMGHSDIASTQIYADMSKKKLRSVYDRTHPRK